MRFWIKVGSQLQTLRTTLLDSQITTLHAMVIPQPLIVANEQKKKGSHAHGTNLMYVFVYIVSIHIFL